MTELKKTVLIMAGGRGTRFWPKSRKSLPKQFLSLTGDGKTMIQLTVERLLPLIDMEDIYISTNLDYKALVQKQLPDIPEENILCEPVGRNTAPCIGLGAIHIAKKYDDALMIVLPSDHQIKMKDLFCHTLEEACEIAVENKNIVQIGITPNYPETGYGYIKYLPKEKKGSAYKVEKFVEKPNVEKAREYLESNQYLWNAGQFIWKVSTVLAEMKEYMPDTYEHLMNIQEAIGTDGYEKVLNDEFRAMKSISIDYGVMEKAKDIYVIPGNFGWDDVGSWLAVGRLQKKNKEGNVIDGDVITINTEDSIIQGNNKLIAVVGLDNIIVVDTDDALLICDEDHAGEIRDVMKALEEKGREELL
ncbi:MAG: mannose-1-phosphate guanylyltransferase [Solobacterium sp.]|nr:mannose-1-phosphate guanylyltransferase [Solobacterium sp.]